MNFKNKTILITGMCLLLVSLVSAAIPYTFNIHGKLTDNNGYPSTGTYSMNFTIYNASTSGTILYSQLQNVTTDLGGIYTLILTDLEAVNFSQQTYLGITVDADSEMVPRISLTSVPSALATNVTGGGGVSFWEASGDNIYYDSGNVTIGGASSEGILGLVSADTETISSIDNTGVLGDSVIKFQLGGTTLLTLGIRDAGTNDPFEFNYADGLDSSPELTITTDDILIGTPTVGAASLIFNNKLENTCPFIGDVNVDDTNYLVLPVSTCTYDDFSNGIEGQLLVIICPRPTAVTITVADTPREIGLSGGNDFVCANAGDTLTLFMGPPPFNEWFELSRSFNS